MPWNSGLLGCQEPSGKGVPACVPSLLLRSFTWMWSDFPSFWGTGRRANMNTTKKWRDSSRKPPLVPGHGLPEGQHGACREVSSPEINRQKGSPPPVPLVLPSTPTHTHVPGNGTGPLMDGLCPPGRFLVCLPRALWLSHTQTQENEKR